MKKLSFLTVYLLTVFASLAQADSVSTPIQLKFEPFTAYVRTMDNKMIKARLCATNDSQLVLGKPFAVPHPVPIENIKSFTLKRKNSVLRGVLIGFGVGALTGIIIGFASGDDPVQTPDNYDYSTDPFGLGSGLSNMLGSGLSNMVALTAGEKAAGLGIILGASGAGFGALIGALLKKKFIIGGKKETYHDLQGELMMKLVQK